MGLDAAKKERDNAFDKALNSLSQFDSNTDTLKQLAEYIVQRVN